VKPVSYAVGGFVLGVLVTGLLLTGGFSSRARAGMADADAAGPQVLLDERDMRLTYANAYRIHSAPEEIVIDLGFNMANPNKDGPGPKGDLLFKVSDRLVMTYPTTKKLSQSLSTVISRYEKQYGEIQVEPKPRTN
jgi:hypothetical protein